MVLVTCGALATASLDNAARPVRQFFLLLRGFPPRQRRCRARRHRPGRKSGNAVKSKSLCWWGLRPVERKLHVTLSETIHREHILYNGSAVGRCSALRLACARERFETRVLLVCSS